MHNEYWIRDKIIRHQNSKKHLGQKSNNMHIKGRLHTCMKGWKILYMPLHHVHVRTAENLEIWKK